MEHLYQYSATWPVLFWLYHLKLKCKIEEMKIPVIVKVKYSKLILYYI